MQFIDSTGRLPAPLKRALEWQNESHSTGEADISCTGLIDSPLIHYLKRKHDADIVIDYSDRLWPLFGSIAHSVIERFGTDEDGEHIEKKVFATFGDYTVSGQFDYLSANGILSDYKMTSSYAVAKGCKPEWIAQENVYLCLLRHSNDESDRILAASITGLQIVALLRDHGPRMKAQFPTQIAIVDVPLWTDEQALAYIHERIYVHQQAEQTGQCPAECSESEKWIREEMYAVMKQGRKSSVKNFKFSDYASQEAAEQAAQAYIQKGEKGTSPSTCSVVLRKSEAKRCEHYCTLKDYCPYRQNENENENENEQDGW